MSTHPAQNAANLVGQASLMNAATSMGLGGQIGGVLASGKTYNPYAEAVDRARHSQNKVVFSGKIEVVKVANGYMVNIGRTEGYEYETHIAANAQEVNDIIVSQMVSFRLEG